jgi:chromosome segregation ATPase
LQHSTSQRKNPVITRVIKRDGNKSAFTLNGGPSTGKAVQALASSFNIQIDNLCQFLPQDKVVEFAQMSPIELMASTQRAVAGSDMAKMHEDLKKLRTAQSDFMNKTQADRAHLSHLENRQDGQRTEVERMRERALAQKRLDWFEQCRPLAQYADARRKYEEAKQKVKALTEDLKDLKRISAPRLADLKSKTSYEAQIRALKTRRAKDLSASERECQQKANVIGQSEDLIKEFDNKIEAEKKEIPKKREEMKRLQAKIVDLKRRKAERPEEFDSPAVNAEIQGLRNQQRDLDVKKADLESKKFALREQGQLKNNALKEFAAQLEGLETQAGKQENKLNSLSRETFKAWKWIQDNRGVFSEHVYGPPIVECSLKDPRMADAVESLLQESDFKFITVQNQQDFKLLQQKLFKEMKFHDVSLRVCPTNNLEQFRPPLAPEEMERFGLHSWVLDHVEGPATVIAMLCLERSLHRCGISSRELSQQQHDDLATTAVMSYVVGKKSYQFIRRPEYGSAGTSARVRDVLPARRWTDQPVDMGRRAAIQRSMNEVKGENEIIKSEFNDIKTEIEQLMEKKAELGTQWDEKRQERDAKQQALMEWKAIDTKIQDQEEKVRKLHETLEGFKARIRGLREEMDAALVGKTEAVLQFTSATRDLKLKMASLLEAEMLHIEAQSDLEVLTASNEHTVQMIERKEDEKSEANQIYNQQRDRAKVVLNSVHRLRDEAHRLAEEEDDSGLLDIFTHVAQLDEEKLDSEIDAEKAKLELTEGGSAAIIREYEERAKVIERLRAKLQDAVKSQEDFKHGIREIRDKWEGRLEEIVGKINDAFSDSFARIGCAGQVAVYKASSENPEDCTEENGGVDNGLDFANWAIHISVKFREQERLSLLDSHRQSGGERAVSTIFYLMALQSLSRAPFRVVDEINQGMDPRNERMVHGRMVDIAAEDGGSQYFLITPKLLDGLKYRRGMTVLCIVSGENVPAARQQDENGRWVDGPKVDFRALVQKAEEEGLGAFQHQRQRRIDSGMGRSSGLESSGRSTAVGA